MNIFRAKDTKVRNGGGEIIKKKENRRRKSRDLQHIKGSRKIETFSVRNIRPFKLIKIIVIVRDTEITVPIVICTQETPAKIMTQEKNSTEITKILNKKVTKIHTKRKKILLIT